MLFAAAIASLTSCGAFFGARAWPLGISFALLPATGGGGAWSSPTPPLPASARPGRASASAAAQAATAAAGLGTNADLSNKIRSPSSACGVS